MTNDPPIPQAPPRTRRRWIGVVLGIGLALVILLAGLALGGWRTARTFHSRGRQADAAVDRFHALLNASNFEGIYAAADPLFRSTTSRSDALQSFSAVRRKLGSAGFARRTYIQLQVRPQGRFMNVQYDTAFVSGAAHESFTWRITSDGLQLAGYNVNSPQLLK